MLTKDESEREKEGEENDVREKENDNGGYSKFSINIHHSKHKTCQIDRLTSSNILKNITYFHEMYINQNKPVIIIFEEINQLKKIFSLKNLSFDDKVIINIGKIPYSHHYGYEKQSIKLKLYIKHYMQVYTELLQKTLKPKNVISLPDELGTSLSFFVFLSLSTIISHHITLKIS